MDLVFGNYNNFAKIYFEILILLIVNNFETYLYLIYTTFIPKPAQNPI